MVGSNNYRDERFRKRWSLNTNHNWSWTTTEVKPETQTTTQPTTATEPEVETQTKTQPTTVVKSEVETQNTTQPTIVAELELETKITTQPTTVAEHELETQVTNQTTIFKSIPRLDPTHKLPPKVEPDIQTTEKILKKLKVPVSNNIQLRVFDSFITLTKGDIDKTFSNFKIVTTELLL